MTGAVLPGRPAQPRLTAVPVLAAAAVAAALAVAGCGAPGPTAGPVLVDDEYAATVCVDRYYVRVPDVACRAGSPYRLVYDEYRFGDPYPVAPPIGAAVNPRIYVVTLPPRVSPQHVEHGPPSSTTRATTRPPTTAAPRSSTTVQRGGLGVPAAPSTASRPRPAPSTTRAAAPTSRRTR